MPENKSSFPSLTFHPKLQLPLCSVWTRAYFFWYLIFLLLHCRYHKILLFGPCWSKYCDCWFFCRRIRNFLNDLFVISLKPGFSCQLHSCYLNIFLGSGKASEYFFFFGIIILFCLLIDMFLLSEWTHHLNAVHLCIFYKMFRPFVSAIIG